MTLLAFCVSQKYGCTHLRHFVLNDSESALNLIAPSIQTAFGKSAVYMIAANFCYLSRRAHLRKRTRISLLRIRTMREPGVTLSLYLTMLLTWQTFTAVFPVVELVARILGHVSFFYSYPNAAGVGIIFEPLPAQCLSMSKRVKQQIRIDWHKFKYNVGDIGRDGYRHPPTRYRNLPHVDIPKRKVKHWPWRRKFIQMNQL
mmetsp:Transcript_45889/g.53680  ORF Transcript_45889/g.53680 Transcript_45889/m.53680 type:complete len:201 (-) Transcript_45889:173-775(-)